MKLTDIIKNLAQNFVAHAERTDNPHEVTAEQVGLGAVDNTADADKPVSLPMQAALDKKADRLKVGLSLVSVGDGVSPSEIAIKLLNADGAEVQRDFLVRIRLCDPVEPFETDQSANSLILDGPGYTAEVLTAGKDFVGLIPNGSGTLLLQHNVPAQTNYVRVGPALVGSEDADYTSNVEVTPTGV